MAARLTTPPPYGYRLKVLHELEPIPGEQAALYLVAHLRRRGWTLQKIADELNTLDLKTRTGVPWSRQNVHVIVDRLDVDDLAATG